MTEKFRFLLFLFLCPMWAESTKCFSCLYAGAGPIVCANEIVASKLPPTVSTIDCGIGKRCFAERTRYVAGGSVYSVSRGCLPENDVVENGCRSDIHFEKCRFVCDDKLCNGKKVLNVNFTISPTTRNDFSSHRTKAPTTKNPRLSPTSTNHPFLTTCFACSWSGTAHASENCLRDPREFPDLFIKTVFCSKNCQTHSIRNKRNGKLRSIFRGCSIERPKKVCVSDLYFQTCVSICAENRCNMNEVEFIKKQKTTKGGGSRISCFNFLIVLLLILISPVLGEI